jgi:hypothetical protein
MDLFHSGGNQKSEGEVNQLVKEVICAPGFNPTQLVDFNIQKGNKNLDQAHMERHKDGMPFLSDDWREVSVDIEIPVPIQNVPPKTFQVPGLYHRSIISAIKDTWGSITSCQFHLTPFKHIHINPLNEEET